MKYFLATYELLDREHEHTKHGIVVAEHEHEATTYAQSQEHGAVDKDEEAKLTFWDYGDGFTATTLESVTEITKRDVDCLQRLGVAFVMN